MIGTSRITLTEGVASTAVVDALGASGLDRDGVEQTIELASRRLMTRLGLRDAPLTITRDGLTCRNVCGIVRLNRSVEVDLAPKFLGSQHDGWREDFLVIASLTGQGGLLGDDVTARYGASADLASLIGRMFVARFEEHHRRPLRTYRRERWRAWEVDGDLLFEENIVPDLSGYAQEGLIRDSRNHFNATVSAAAAVLSGEVRDPAVREGLDRVVATLGAQAPAPAVLPPLPSRHEHWADLIDLASRILDSFGLHLAEGALAVPGFVLKAWQAWERLLTRALRAQLAGRYQTHRQFVLGTRNEDELSVDPDGTVLDAAEEPDFLTDAKYRATIVRSSTRIAQSDVYEALAFCKAADVDAIILLYPRVARPGDPVGELGQVDVFERVQSEGVSIIGAEVEVRRIGERRAFRQFAAALATGCSGVAAEARA